MYKSIENIDRVIKVTERMLERLATTSSFVAYQNILEETGDYVASVDRK